METFARCAAAPSIGMKWAALLSPQMTARALALSQAAPAQRSLSVGLLRQDQFHIASSDRMGRIDEGTLAAAPSVKMTIAHTPPMAS